MYSSYIVSSFPVFILFLADIMPLYFFHHYSKNLIYFKFSAYHSFEHFFEPSIPPFRFHSIVFCFVFFIWSNLYTEHHLLPSFTISFHSFSIRNISFLSYKFIWRFNSFLPFFLPSFLPFFLPSIQASFVLDFSFFPFFFFPFLPSCTFLKFFFFFLIFIQLFVPSFLPYVLPYGLLF